ncbi:MAG: hypothetical protein E7372_02015 [Clostridiales bacterium]|nr:hypothetical protein [Clostridiales bacterium]
MDLLQFITSLLGNDNMVKLLSPIIELLRQNSFDIKKVLASLDPEMLKPIIEEFMKSINNRPAQSAERTNGLQPISNIADRDIVFALNKYLADA